MGILVILICFVGSGALTIFLVRLFCEDRRERKCHVTRVENLLGAEAELNLDRRSLAPVQVPERMPREKISAIEVRNRKIISTGTGTLGAAD